MQANAGLVAFLGVALAAGCSNSSSTSWKEYQAPDGKFTVQLPGVPSLKAVPDGWQEISAALKAERHFLFSILYKDFPTELSQEELERMAANSRNGMVARQGNTLLEEKTIALGRHPGREMRFAIAQFDDVSINRSYAVGNRYYSITAIVSKWQADAPDVARFLDSFQVSD
jgi:hypothetical protein